MHPYFLVWVFFLLFFFFKLKPPPMSLRLRQDPDLLVWVFCEFF